MAVKNKIIARNLKKVDKEAETINNLAKIHIQFRFHGKFSATVLDQKFKKMFDIVLKGFDISICKPSGPLSVKSSLMVHRVSVDHWIPARVYAATEKKRKSIFGGVEDAERGSMRSTTKVRFRAGDHSRRRDMSVEHDFLNFSPIKEVDESRGVRFRTNSPRVLSYRNADNQMNERTIYRSRKRCQKDIKPERIQK